MDQNTKLSTPPDLDFACPQVNKKVKPMERFEIHGNSLIFRDHVPKDDMQTHKYRNIPLEHFHYRLTTFTILIHPSQTYKRTLRSR